MAAPPPPVKQRAVRWLVQTLVVALLLLAGAAATFAIATHGWQIENALGLQSCFSTQDFRYGLRNANVSTGAIMQKALVFHQGINSTPPDITDEAALRMFEFDWKDDYDDPLLKLPETEIGPPGMKGRQLAQGDVLHHRIIQPIRSGWPMYALYGVTSDIDTNSWPAMTTARAVRRGIAEGTDMSPTIPLPLGFAVNTLFFASVFAAAIFLPFLGFRWIRRAVRRENAQCVDCGYQLTSRVAACPECGRGMSPNKSG